MSAAPATPNYVLIVEGPGDTDFLDILMSRLGKTVDIHPPKARGLKGNGISNVLKTLPIDLGLAASGSIQRIGVVVDADHTGINGGFQSRRQEIVAILNQFGYEVNGVLPPAQPNIGEIFLHPRGSAPFGLWIMPNHLNDGCLEDFVSPMITDANQKLALAHGVASLDSRPQNLQFYNPVCHKSKAEVATWLAMQKPPGMPIDLALKTELLDGGTPNLNAFNIWVDKVFP